MYLLCLHKPVCSLSWLQEHSLPHPRTGTHRFAVSLPWCMRCSWAQHPKAALKCSCFCSHPALFLAQDITVNVHERRWHKLWQNNKFKEKYLILCKLKCSFRSEQAENRHKYEKFLKAGAYLSFYENKCVDSRLAVVQNFALT